jgi:hypothetical protein
MISSGELHLTEVIRRYADNVVDAYPDTDLRTLADELEADNELYDDGSETCSVIATELRIRAAVGIRKWR